jgi:hypothetical protein
MFTIRGFNTHESLSNYIAFKPILSGATVPLTIKIPWTIESAILGNEQRVSFKMCRG